MTGRPESTEPEAPNQDLFLPTQVAPLPNLQTGNGATTSQYDDERGRSDPIGEAGTYTHHAPDVGRLHRVLCHLRLAARIHRIPYLQMNIVVAYI